VIKRHHTKETCQCCISAIEAHINDKEAAYQINISLLYINNGGNISEVYFSKVF
jgi:hypothetical protein